MAGNSLTIASTLQCPHGGRVIIISANLRARAVSASMATVSDVFIIAGCLLSSPCLTVRWLVPDVRVKANSSLSLSRSSVGLCLNALQIPQGPVIIINTQVRVKSQ